MAAQVEGTLRQRMIARLADRGASELPGLDGQFLAARRSLDDDPDSYFTLELSDGEWVLEWTRDRGQLGRRQRAGLERYADAVLAAKVGALRDALQGPLTLLAASELLDLPVDLVAAAVANGSLPARAGDGSRMTVAFADLLDWGNANQDRLGGWFRLDPTLEISRA